MIYPGLNGPVYNAKLINTAPIIQIPTTGSSLYSLNHQRNYGNNPPIYPISIKFLKLTWWFILKLLSQSEPSALSTYINMLLSNLEMEFSSLYIKWVDFGGPKQRFTISLRCDHIGSCMHKPMCGEIQSLLPALLIPLISVPNAQTACLYTNSYHR